MAAVEAVEHADDDEQPDLRRRGARSRPPIRRASRPAVGGVPGSGAGAGVGGRHRGPVDVLGRRRGPRGPDVDQDLVGHDPGPLDPAERDEDAIVIHEPKRASEATSRAARQPGGRTGPGWRPLVRVRDPDHRERLEPGIERQQEAAHGVGACRCGLPECVQVDGVVETERAARGADERRRDTRRRRAASPRSRAMARTYVPAEQRDLDDGDRTAPGRIRPTSTRSDRVDRHPPRGQRPASRRRAPSRRPGGRRP